MAFFQGGGGAHNPMLVMLYARQPILRGNVGAGCHVLVQVERRKVWFCEGFDNDNGTLKMRSPTKLANFALRT